MGVIEVKRLPIVPCFVSPYQPSRAVLRLSHEYIEIGRLPNPARRQLLFRLKAALYIVTSAYQPLITILVL